MPVPEVCVEEILKEKDSLWEGEEPYEIFWTAAENLYDAAHSNEECFNSLKVVDRVTFQELRAAFRPDRDPIDVKWTGDKVWRLARKLIDNGNLFTNSIEPSCCGVGLEKPTGDCIHDRCYLTNCSERELEHYGYSEEEIKEKLQDCYMTCDCPEGYADYDPLEYAYENVVFRTRDGKILMYYSDYPEQLGKCVGWYERARTEDDVSEMVLALDCMINAAHLSGSLAEFLVEGGVRTLDTLKEMQY